MNRLIGTATLVAALVALAGVALLRSSFISLKHSAGAAQSAAAAAMDASLPARITFNENIQPVLSENCYYCHGQDATARKADLRLDRPEYAFLTRKSGLPPIVKGHPESSALVQRIVSTDPNQMMPPPTSLHRLTPKQIALLTRWVKEGAQYEEHWAFVKPERAAPPQVKTAGWVKNPIDNFLLARMESAGLAPEPEADRRTIIRRVTLDLTGLPPTPEEVTAFLDDRSTDAYEKVVDRLLASPRYGEHEARYWLDAARYGETVGLHIDEARSIWPYRDWVINAFNSNKPFDQMTVEQVAGDLLPHHTRDQLVATGFTRCGVSTSEGGSIEAELLATYAKEHVEANAAVFMGLTMGCCACHDHKFDPISQKEFYQFTAYFRNTTQRGEGKRNEASTAPFIFVPPAADAARWDALPEEQAGAQKALSAYLAQVHYPELMQTLARVPAEKPVDPTGLELRLPLHDGAGKEIQSGGEGAFEWSSEPKRLADGLLGPAPVLNGDSHAALGDRGDFDTAEKFSVGGWLRATGTTPTGAVIARMETAPGHRGWDLYIEKGRVAPHFISSWPQNALHPIAKQALAADRWQHVFVTYDGTGKAAGVKIYIDGEVQAVSVEKGKDSVSGTIRSSVPLELGQRNDGEGVNNLACQDLRVYRRVLSAEEIRTLARGEMLPEMLATPPDRLSEAQRGWLLTNYFEKRDPHYLELQGKVNALKAEYDAIEKRSAATMVMDDKPTPAFAYLLKRGQYDQLGEKVEPGVPKVLPPLPADAPKNRLGLAQWMVDPGNPLLSRVTVNRFWQQLFGVGIVRTADDFGIAGDRPSNQPLLDWLAVEFRESGWDVKHMFKLMVTSAAYRQSDRVTPQKQETDPENRLVSRGPRFRLDGETIRDQALAASGLLVPDIGGPSVKPYQPPGIWEVVSMTDEHYVADKGPGLYRRSLYTYWKKLAPQPQLTTFDAPTRETCIVRRDRTNTPLQALLVENDPQYVEAARHLAVRAITASQDPAQRMDYMSERLLARPLADNERAILLKSLAAFNDTYTKKPDAAAKLIRVGDSEPDPAIPAPEQAAWTMVASEFLNLDETLNK